MAAAWSASHSQPTRLKRRQSDRPYEDDNRFVKRFNMLKLSPYSQVYVPISPDGARQTPRTTAGPGLRSGELEKLVALQDGRAPYGAGQPGRAGTGQAGQFMQVDETPDRIFIANIDDELSDDADADSNPDRPIFIADIDKHLLRVPRPMSAFSGRESERLVPMSSNQMVLYRPISPARLVRDTQLEKENNDGLDVTELPDDAGTTFPGRRSQAQYEEGPALSDSRSSSPLDPTGREGPRVFELSDSSDCADEDVNMD